MTSSHRLDPLLAPKSIAFVGASQRPKTSGNHMVRAAVLEGYKGAVYPINPRYGEIDGLRCYASLSELPQTVDHVVLAVANDRLESSMRDAIEHGAKAVTIFASCYLPDDKTPNLKRRLTTLACEAGLHVCGGNGMGFANPNARLQVAAFPTNPGLQPGPAAWISQSGSVFGALTYNDRRLRFNLCVSSGAEMVTTCVDYLDWALAQTTTEVVGMFLESIRDPDGFQSALELAAHKQIPVVILKSGRTKASATMALTHTGAIAGEDSTYQALFDRYGVIRVNTLDELAATLLMFSQPRRAGAGGFASIHDSGGECEILLDLADDLGVRVANISDQTRGVLRDNLDPGLEPVNPLDAWGSGRNAVRIFDNCMTALMRDKDTAVGLLVSDIRDGHWHHENMAAVARAVHRKSDRPLAVATNYSNLLHDEISLSLTGDGIPVIDGTREALVAVKALLQYRDFVSREPSAFSCRANNRSLIDKWRRRLENGGALGEYEALALMSDWGIPVVSHRRVDSRERAIGAANALGYPVVLKTANPEVHHKTDVGGVEVNIAEHSEVGAAYDDLSRRFGPDVLVMPWLQGGVEVGIGIKNDAQFGPVIMVAAGGTLVELVDDRAFALAPVDANAASRLLNKVRIVRLLEGVRGDAAKDKAALVSVIVKLSMLGDTLKDVLAEVDINPVIVLSRGCYAVDALVIPRGKTDQEA